MSEYLTDVQAGLALSASWGHPEMLQVQDSGWNFVASSVWGRMESCARVVNPRNFGAVMRLRHSLVGTGRQVRPALEVLHVTF